METNSSFIFFAMISASVNVVFAILESIISPPETFGKLWMVLSNICWNKGTFTFSFFKMKGATFSSTSKIALKMCSFSICCCPKLCANC